MSRDLIPFRAGVGHTSRTAVAAPDVGFSAIPLLQELALTLRVAIPFRDYCRQIERQANRWGTPRLFFATDHDTGPRAPSTPNFIRDAVASVAARSRPESANAWARLTDLIDDAFTVCANSIEARRVARAIPDLREQLAELSADHRACRDLAALLAVADDLVVTVLHPEAQTGFRFQVRGIADLAQFHILFADAVIGSPARGFLPGNRPDIRLVDACIDQPTDLEVNIATARFQFFAPSALRADVTLPRGFAGVDHWLWGHESLRQIAPISGERLLLVGEAAYPRQWVVNRRFSALRGEVELLKILPAAEVEVRLRELVGEGRPPATRRQAA